MLPWPTREAADRFGDRPALMTATETLSHAVLHARVEAAARRLAAHGLAPGATAALWDTNGPDWVVAAHAVWRCGATLLPLSTRWTDAEAGVALQRLTPAFVLGSAAFAARAEGLGLRALTHEAWRHGPQAETLPQGPHQGPEGSESWRGPLPAAPDPDAPMALLLTSGTSGVPKAASLPWRAMAASADAVAQAIALSPDDRWWLGMPFFHVGGLSALLRCCRSGAAAVIAERFEPARTLDELSTQSVTVASFVPTMLQGLIAAKGDRPWPGALRLAMLGGAAAPAELLDACPFAVATYGLTEACSTVTLVRPDATGKGTRKGSEPSGPLRVPLGASRLSAGTPVPGVEVRILGPAGDVLGPGEVGEIAVSGPTLMAGYVGDAAATRAALVDGWLRTGDHGRLAADGSLTVLGRRTDLIVSGGENVYPAEVESALLAHPSVAAAAVVAVPSPRWGQSPFAFVVRRGALDEEALRGWLGDRLARFKHPAGYAWLGALPLLGNGKVDRRALATELSKLGYEVQ
jgi:O-succinylbenzoic acid--CoA ligase